MGTSFKELGGSPVESYSADGMKAERTILVAAADRDAMVRKLMGTTGEFGGGVRAAYPGRYYLVATSVRVAPWPEKAVDQGAFTDIEEHLNEPAEFARLTVQYEVLQANPMDDPPDMEEDTFLTYGMDHGGEYMTIPKGTLVWAAHPEVKPPAEATPTVRVPVIEHRFSWHRVVSPPWSTIRDQVGTVSSAAIFGIGAGLLLFEGATSEKEFTGIDDLSYPQYGHRLNYVFREKQIRVLGAQKLGWQYTWRGQQDAIAAGWDQLKDSNGNLMYATADHNDLFKYET